MRITSVILVYRKIFFPRHERSEKHLINLQNYVPENILDTDINEPNLQEPIQPTIYKPKKEMYEQLKSEILNEFYDLEINFKTSLQRK